MRLRTLNNEIELKLLRELRRPNHPDGWFTSAELAELIDTAPWRARANLTELRKRGLVERGATLERSGYFSITEAGIVAIALADQLRLT